MYCTFGTHSARVIEWKILLKKNSPTAQKWDELTHAHSYNTVYATCRIEEDLKRHFICHEHDHENLIKMRVMKVIQCRPSLSLWVELRDEWSTKMVFLFASFLIFINWMQRIYKMFRTERNKQQQVATLLNNKYEGNHRNQKQ